MGNARIERVHGNMLVMNKRPFEDENLSMSARGMLATLLATDKGIDEYYTGTNRTPITELINKGYIYKSDEEGIVSYDVNDIPSDKKKKSKSVKSAKYQKILHEAIGGPMWSTKKLCVHHINHNREDNRVRNLLLLPKKLHGKYHMLCNIVDFMRCNIMDKDLDLDILCHAQTIIDYVEVKYEMAVILQAHIEAVDMAKFNRATETEFNGLACIYNMAKSIYDKYL